MSFRRTKIVATLGPACDPIMDKLIEAGLNVARMNFSHGDHAEHEARWQKLQSAIKNSGKTIAIMVDTQGPKVRTSTFKDGSMELIEGETVFLKQGNADGGLINEEKTIYVNYHKLLDALKEHKIVYFADGLLEVKVEEVHKDKASAKVITGGKISNHKGVNVPNLEWDLPAIGSKDVKDIHWGIAHNVDYIAQSFVRNANDVRQLKKILEDEDASHIKVIAKIEEYPAVQNIDEIIEVADGIMVARGDLGVQMHIEQVPTVQKMIIKKCNRAAKPVITATQMLESMTTAPFPTRAEVTDVANAILDGSDAVMLSGETSVGKYPIKVIQMMAKISQQTEDKVLKYNRFDKYPIESESTKPANVTLAIANSACKIALEVKATAIIAYTETGRTPECLSRIRPNMPIIGITDEVRTARRMCLYGGVIPLVLNEHNKLDEVLRQATDAAQQTKLVKKGDLVVVVTGLPFGKSGETNLIKVQTV